MILDKTGEKPKIGDSVYFINALWDSKSFLQVGIVLSVQAKWIDVQWELLTYKWNTETNKHDILNTEILTSRVKDNFIIKNS